MWVKISKPEDTKKLKVGDKVRVDGVEYKVKRTYAPTDYGFSVDSALAPGGKTLTDYRVRCFGYTIELWEEGEGKMIERDKEYSIKLTGEELFLVTLLLAKTNGDMLIRLWGELKSISGITDDLTSTIPLGYINLASEEANIMEVMDEFFTKPETEKKKNIREMKEKYEALGRAIEQACKEG